MKKIAVFPGSFDPITKGHFSVVEKAIDLFDEIYIAVGKNTSKQAYFSNEEKVEMAEKAFRNFPTVKVIQFEGLTVDVCTSLGAKYILRGLRNGIDFEYEKNIALLNNEMNGEIETVFIISSPEFQAINSRIIREIMKSGGDVSKFLPFEM